MPKVRRANAKKGPPEGWELIEPTLEELEAKMREAETESHEGKRKVESLWPIFKIHHQRSRYIYDLFYRRKAISRGECSVSAVARDFSMSSHLQSSTTTASSRRSRTATSSPSGRSRATRTCAA